jgi:hypothetical protein
VAVVLIASLRPYTNKDEFRAADDVQLFHYCDKDESLKPGGKEVLNR